MIEELEIRSTTKTTWIIPTSGTTSNAKLVKHDLGSLTESVKIQNREGVNFRWAALYEIYRFAGLQVFLQSLASSSTLILQPSNLPFPEKINKLIIERCNAISGTPSLFRKILMLPESNKLPLKQITLGGEIVDQSILDSLKATYQSSRITHIYATTETGVVFSVNDGKAGFPVSYVECDHYKEKIRIIDNFVHVKPKTARRKIYINGAIEEINGFYNTKDKVYSINKRYYFLGRDDGTINVGGQKIYPEEIEQVLLDHPLVEAVIVVGKPSSILGNIIMAKLVLKKDREYDSHTFSKEIHTYCSHRLEKYKMPYKFEIADKIQLNDSGKVRRK